MTPEERQMLTDLFERIRSTSSAPRDPQAEAFINDAIRAQPHAPYVMAQTVLVQQNALEGAQRRIQELEAQLRASPPQPQQETSFLGRLFGGGANAPAPQHPAPYDSSAYQRGPAPGYPQQPGYAPPPPRGNAPQPGFAPQAGPWGAAPAASAGGGFLSGALQTATGVAGGMLAANAIEGLFSGHRGGGMFGGAGLGGAGFGGGPTEIIEETGPREVINNYYNDSPSGGDPQGFVSDDSVDVSDASDSWDDSSSGGSWDN